MLSPSLNWQYRIIYTIVVNRKLLILHIKPLLEQVWMKKGYEPVTVCSPNYISFPTFQNTIDTESKERTISLSQLGKFYISGPHEGSILSSSHRNRGQCFDWTKDEIMADCLQWPWVTHAEFRGRPPRPSSVDHCYKPGGKMQLRHIWTPFLPTVDLNKARPCGQRIFNGKYVAFLITRMSSICTRPFPLRNTLN